MKFAGLLLMFSLVTFAQSDAPGITVDSGGELLHRPPVVHPVEGSPGGLIVLEATINAKGEVTDAHVVSGPERIAQAGTA